MNKLYIKIKVVNKDNKVREIIKRADKLRYMRKYFPSKDEILKQMKLNLLKIKSGKYFESDLILKKQIENNEFDLLLKAMASDGMLSIPKGLNKIEIYSNLNQLPVFIMERNEAA